MCGIAGSGKTTYAKSLEARGFTRLSADELIWENFGRYGIDYSPDKYNKYQGKVRIIIIKQLEKLLTRNQPVVLDLSFWCKDERDVFKNIILTNKEKILDCISKDFLRISTKEIKAQV